MDKTKKFTALSGLATIICIFIFVWVISHNWDMHTCLFWAVMLLLSGMAVNANYEDEKNGTQR
jgi:hypothetical protein